MLYRASGMRGQKIKSSWWDKIDLIQNLTILDHCSNEPFTVWLELLRSLVETKEIRFDGPALLVSLKKQRFWLSKQLHTAFSSILITTDDHWTRSLYKASCGQYDEYPWRINRSEWILPKFGTNQLLLSTLDQTIVDHESTIIRLSWSTQLLRWPYSAS